MLEDLEPTAPMQLSFAGCGFLCIYHSGVCAAIKEYAPQLAQNRIRGSSAGAIAAAGLICNVCMSHATSTILQCVTEARAGSLQALSPNFDIFGLVRRGLEESLPPNAHILCSGRLLISATRARDYANVVISEFDSRDELIQAILCSCFIPFYCGRTPPTYRGEHYIDGGFSDNQPGKWEPGTVTVSPFSGESDICPSDEDSASLFGFDFCGTNIQFTTQNAWRMVVILFPPSPEVCSRICRQGFDDALRFLTKNNLVPCVKCLTVQSNAIPVPSSAQNGGPALAKSSSEQFAVDQRIREIRRRRALTAPSAAAKNHKLRHECERCMEPLDRFEPPRFSAVPLPSVVQKTLADMEARNKASWLTWLRQWRIIRYWLRLVMPPMLLPFELLQFTLRKIRSWLKRTALAPAEAYLVRFQLLVDFLLQEIEQRCLLHSPTAAPAGVFPFSVLPVGPLSALRLTDSSQPAAVAGGSPSVSTTSMPPQRKLSLISQRKMSTTVAPLDLAIPSSITGEEEEGQEEDAKLRREDSKRVLQQFCERHDAVLAFHYMDDETNQLKICQIFDANGRNPRQHCHSGNLAIPLEYAGQEEAAAAAQTAEDEAAKAAARCGEDSGLSLEEGEEAVGSQQNSSGQRRNSQRKDACCSPVRHFSAKTAPTKPLPAAVRRHTFSSRSARLSASARTLVSLAAAGQKPPASRFVAPGSRLYASNSMNALKPAELAAGKNAALRRKVSMQTAAERRQSADDSSSSESEATEKAQPRAKQQRKQQPWAAKAQQK